MSGEVEQGVLGLGQLKYQDSCYTFEYLVDHNLCLIGFSTTAGQGGIVFFLPSLIARLPHAVRRFINRDFFAREMNCGWI